MIDMGSNNEMVMPVTPFGGNGGNGGFGEQIRNEIESIRRK